MNLIDRKCPICNNNSYINFHKFKFSDTTYSIDICDICGFVFQNPIKMGNHYHELECSYPKDYFYHSSRRASYILDFCEILPNFSGNILDIGAGFGYTIINMCSLLPISNYKVGITLENLEKRPELKKIKKVKLYNFDFEDNDKFDNFVKKLGNVKFDFIIMSHVLEHFINPSKVISNVKKLLSKNGSLYIEVPSFYNAEYRIKSVWRPEHLSYFTQKSLENLLFNQGLNIYKIKDSKIWGNIKVRCKDDSYYDYDVIKEHDVIKKYKANKFAKFIQRLKHKLNFKYGDNE